jgi:hypothetical protein
MAAGWKDATAAFNARAYEFKTRYSCRAYSTMRLKDTIVSFDEPEWLFPLSVHGGRRKFFYAHNRGQLTPTTSLTKLQKRDGVVMKTYTVKEDDVLGVRSWRVR